MRSWGVGTDGYTDPLDAMKVVSNIGPVSRRLYRWDETIAGTERRKKDNDIVY